jgi:hypothetical protein
MQRATGHASALIPCRTFTQARAPVSLPIGMFCINFGSVSNCSAYWLVRTPDDPTRSLTTHVLFS